MKYTVSGFLTVSCCTEVEANSKSEALEIAEEREVAELCCNPFIGTDDEVWHFGNDGVPQKTKVD